MCAEAGTENVYGAVGNAVHAMRSSEPMAGLPEQGMEYKA